MLPPMARLWHRREEGAARESAGGGGGLVTRAGRARRGGSGGGGSCVPVPPTPGCPACRRRPGRPGRLAPAASSRRGPSLLPLPSLAAAAPSQGGGGGKLSRAGSPRPGCVSPHRPLGIRARRALRPRRAPAWTPPRLPGPRAPTWRPPAPHSLRTALASARCPPVQRLRPLTPAVRSAVRPAEQDRTAPDTRAAAAAATAH